MHQTTHLSPNRVNTSFAPDGEAASCFGSCYQEVHMYILHTEVLCLKWFFCIVLNKCIFFWPKKLAGLQHVKTGVKRSWLFCPEGRNKQANPKLKLQVNFTVQPLHGAQTWEATWSQTVKRAHLKMPSAHRQVMIIDLIHCNVKCNGLACTTAEKGLKASRGFAIVELKALWLFEMLWPQCSPAQATS